MNEVGQPIGFPVDAWTQPLPPSGKPLRGSYCRLERLDPKRHAQSLYDSCAAADTDALWTYMSAGPFASLTEFRTWVEQSAATSDPLFFSVTVSGEERTTGMAAYLNVKPSSGCIEIGHILFSRSLQNTPASTEAIYLLLGRAFDQSGYRRCEWKCDSLNSGSRSAALRLGFTYEGTFRQALVYKGRNRDTSWYSMIDREWPKRRDAFEQWLSPANFDPSGLQRRKLAYFQDPSGAGEHSRAI